MATSVETIEIILKLSKFILKHAQIPNVKGPKVSIQLRTCLDAARRKTSQKYKKAFFLFKVYLYRILKLKFKINI